ncbi:MAG: helix-turn-helix transcriptional regulator, partial [Candidatus Sericytochromatia bacterium]
HIDPTTWRGAGTQAGEAFPTLQEAVFRGLQLRMTYQKADGAVSDRVVSPLGLVAKGTAWYMVALSNGELRSFKTTRVQAASLLPDPVVPPDGFDLAAYWSASAGGFEAVLPRFALTARLPASLLPRLSFGGRFVRLESAEPPDAAGWCVAHFRCDGEEEAIAFALGQGPTLEVLSPASLRPELARRAAETVARYLTER